MKRRTFSFLAAALGVSLVVGSAQAAPQSIAVPAYFYPSYPDPLWQQMEDAHPVVKFAVMNPASGAGAMPDPNYVSQIAATRAAGVLVIGYVYSSYATRDPALLETDIDNYYDWYDVDGIFIDEAANDCASQPYYADLDAYVKGKGGLGLTVINPGTVTPECFATAADVILNFEGSYTSYQSFAPAGWESGYDASRFWHLVYATNESDVPAAVLLSQSRNAGYVYVTPDVLANPWDTLPGPSYWATELAYVQPGASECAPPVAKAKLQLRGLSTPESDDTLRFSGSFVLAGTPDIDPLADGFRFVVSDAGGSEADITLPSGAYGGDPGSGWIGGDGKWKYRDDSDAPASGIGKTQLKVKTDGLTTTVSFKIFGVDGSFPADVSELPLSGVAFADPAAPTTNCATASFPGPKPVCLATNEGDGIKCK